MPLQTRIEEQVLGLQHQVQAIQDGQDQLQVVTGASQNVNGVELAKGIAQQQERFNRLAEAMKEMDANVEGTLRVMLGDLGTGELLSSTLAVSAVGYTFLLQS